MMKHAAPFSLALISVAMLTGALVGAPDKATVIVVPKDGIAAEARNATYSSDTEWFSVTGNESVGISYCAEMARVMERFLVREFKWRRPVEMPRVNVFLVSQAQLEWRAPFSIAINRADRRTALWLSREANVRRDDVEVALARALLIHVGQIRRATGTAIVPPDWLVWALILEERFEREPWLLDALVRRSRKIQPIEPAWLFSPRNTSDAGWREQAFWFLRHLRRELAENEESARTVLGALAAGEVPETVIAQAFPKIADNRDRGALWWPMGYTQLVHETEAWTQTLEATREYLRDAMRFEFGLDDDDSVWHASRIIALRELRFVRETVAERWRNLLHNIGHANPVWHNTWLAYGQFLEKFGDLNMRSDKLMELWMKVEEEMAIARETEAEIQRILAE